MAVHHKTVTGINIAWLEEGIVFLVGTHDHVTIQSNTEEVISALEILGVVKRVGILNWVIVAASE